MALTINGTTGIETNTDTGKIKVGAGDDLELHSDGENGYATATQGNLWLRSDTHVFLSNEASNEYFLKAVNNGTVELYHNGTKQCETSANGLAFPSGKGIDFSATSDASGKTGELLSDYEEGTWTPAYNTNAVTSTTYTNTGGHYTRVGNLVTFTARVQMTGSTSTTGNPIFLEGLPLASSGSHRSGGANFSYQDNWYSSSSTGTMSQVAMYIADGESKIGFYDGDGNHVDADTLYANAQKTIALYGFYYV